MRQREERREGTRTAFELTMRFRWIVLVPVLVLVGAVPASGVLAEAELTKPGVIRITNREVDRSLVDLGPPGPTPGDQLVLTQLLYNRRITSRALGHQEMLCTYLGRGGVLGGGSRQCTMTFYLPQGRLVATGAVHNLLFYMVPVIGGTGIYDNVGGTLTVTFLGGRPARQLLIFRLTV
jgi:hypothetical protein